jgi:peroxiredoxin
MTGIWLISYIALWVLFLILAVVVLLTLRSLSVVIERIEGLQRGEVESSTTLTVGERVPDVPLDTRDGAHSSLESLRGADTAVVVISPGCGACRDVLAEVAHHAPSSDPLNLRVARTALICVGDVQEVEQELTAAQIPRTLPVFIDSAQIVSARWGVRETPTTLIVDADLLLVRATTGFLSRAKRESARSS